jgi:replicative superfamily II helicase
MPLNLRRLSTRPPSDTVPEPREIFRALQKRGRKYQFPRDVQGEVWTRWSKRRSQQDSLLKLNTGSGKTVVGLVLLKSCLNEGVGPAVYVAPTPYLADQVAREAVELGLQVDQDPRSLAVSSGQSILVTTIKKLFNGRSQFGVGDEVKLEIGSIVIDDAHACLQETEEQFTLLVPRTTEAFAKLLSLFRDALLVQSHTKVYDLAARGESRLGILS